ncbi:hypothetical protein DM992_20330 [Burkholderia sp. JP2-270]|uniref:hypothetical protein n=1 Tax=Burkholderia sp. JP2-270 TaxID=2217913 RepID=UPI000DA2B1D4|nr:hypothetical protein [Burkholderia sp. JP2-270]AWV01861.1 hypothetical protein DM992_20330 [Burkholderia sp. JP2-270]
MLNADARRRSSLARRGTAAAGQCATQPIVATKSGEFNRPETIMSLKDEKDQISGNWRAATHIKMIQL